MRDVSRTTQCRWSIGTEDSVAHFSFFANFCGFSRSNMIANGFGATN
jgi:hypothetical protein